MGGIVKERREDAGVHTWMKKMCICCVMHEKINRKESTKNKRKGPSLKHQSVIALIMYLIFPFSFYLLLSFISNSTRTIALPLFPFPSLPSFKSPSTHQTYTVLQEPPHFLHLQRHLRLGKPLPPRNAESIACHTVFLVIIVRPPSRTSPSLASPPPPQETSPTPKKIHE